MASIPTIAVKMDDQKVLINLSDYNASVHELWESEAEKEEDKEEFFKPFPEQEDEVKEESNETEEKITKRPPGRPKRLQQ